MTKRIPIVSIIIVSYNTRDMTLECIRSIYRGSTNDDFEVIVIDNGSSDGSATAIKKECPEVELIRAEENLGFARANNVAAKGAAGKFILLLNPDTVILQSAIDRLLAFAAANPSAGIWGGRTVYADQSLNPTSCWRFMSPWSLFTQATGLSVIFRNSERYNPEEYGAWARDNEREVDFVCGCFLLIRKELWERLEGFDERFFMYAEEADLCLRARDSGARPLFTPQATVIHHGGASETTRASKINKVFCGKVTFIRKHWSRPKIRVSIWLLKLHSLTRLIGHAALGWICDADEHKQSAREWLQVWRARRTWAQGYGPRPR